MFLNIITPCSRPENLIKISESIKNTIPKENYRWIVIFDFDEFPNKKLIPDNCEVYLHRNELSVVGHAQRNFAIDKIDCGYIYMNDDDTIIHRDLWINIKDLNNDFISFIQEDINGKIRLPGDNIKLNKIDSHNFIVAYSLLDDIRWEIGLYNADGIFAEKCFIKSKNYIYIPKILSTYNSLSID